MSVSDNVLHGLFRLPYRLNVRHKRIKNPFNTTYLLIHGLADTGEAWKPLLDRLPKDSNYVVFDLLGHGLSKRPESSDFYSAYRQAINVRFTYASLGLVGPVVLVGHSFGSLVAAEFAYHFFRKTKRLILCAPPVYRDPVAGRKLRLQQEGVLREIYRQIVKQPKSVVRIYNLATKLRLLGFSKVEISEENFAGFSGTLRAGIISQTAGKHLTSIHIPTRIVFGIADPFIVAKNLTKLAKINPNITIKTLAGAHSIRKNTLKAVLEAIEEPSPA